MTRDQVEQTVRDLADRYGADPFSMPNTDLERLAEAIAVLGQPRVFQIATVLIRAPAFRRKKLLLNQAAKR